MLANYRLHSTLWVVNELLITRRFNLTERATKAEMLVVLLRKTTYLGT